MTGNGLADLRCARRYREPRPPGKAMRIEMATDKKQQRGETGKAPPPRGQKRRPAATGPADAREGERIARRLARAGVASRREAEAMIAAGRVSVNGRVLTSPAVN